MHCFVGTTFNFEKVFGRVAELLDLKFERVLAVEKYKKTVVARSLLCFRATSALGIRELWGADYLKVYRMSGFWD